MEKSQLFVNRANDFDELKSKIIPINPKESNKILLLLGNSGVGKSRFISEFFNRFLNDYIKVKVSLLGTSSTSIDSLFFFNRLYDELLATLESNNSLSYKNILSVSLSEIRLSIGMASASIKIDKLGDYDKQTIKKIKYIINALNNKKRKFIIDIENTHLFDFASFHLLTSILRNTVGHTFIFEYTTTNENNNDLYKFIGALESIGQRIEVDIYRLEKLNLLDAKKIFDFIMPEKNEIKFLEQIYSASGGNLMEIYLLPKVKKNDDFSKSIISTAIKELDNNEKIILFIIYLNKGIIKCSLLYEMLGNNNKTQIFFTAHFVKNILNKLQFKRLINIKLDTAKISHDSIIKELDKTKGEIAFYNAYGIIENHYFTLVEHNNEAVLMLLYLYTVTNDPRVINIIPEIQKIAITQRYPEAILEKINDIKLALYQSEQNKAQLELITIALVEILYIIGNYDNAFDNLLKIYDDSNFLHIAYRGALLALRNSEDDLLNLAILIEKHRHNTRLCLILELHLLIAFMETKLSFESKSFAQNLLKRKEYKSYLEYIFLLENYSEFQNNENALSTLEECVDSYKNHHRPDLALRCMISIASRKAYIGEYDIAEEILNNVEKNYDKISLRHEYILNNKAAIKLLKKDYGNETEQLLSDALILNLNNYERKIILSNLLIIYTENNKFTLAEDIITELEHYIRTTKYKYEEITHILLQNIRYYYLKSNNNDGIKKYTEKLLLLLNENISSSLKEYINATIINVPIKDPKHQWFIYSSFQYRPDFLGYWQFEIPKNL